MALRDSPFENLKVPLGWAAALALVAAVAAAVVLLVLDRGDEGPRGANDAVRGGFETAAAPVGGVFAAPVRWLGQLSDHIDDYFFAVSENRRLREELARLRAEQDAVVALRNLNARYEAMLGVRVEPDVPLLTARSVSEARGPFRRSRLIDVGSSRGVEVGNPVINEHGLIGRVVGTSGSVSRVLLVTDVASQIPVLVGRTDARAIMRGDGSGNPRLEFVRGADALEVGDRILSSGDGGGVPRGLPIGVAARGIDGTWRVKLFSDRGAIDFVRVMLFEDFSQLANGQTLDAPPLAALDTAPPPTPQVVAQIDDAAGRRRAEEERRRLAEQERREREAADARAREAAAARAREEAAAQATPEPAAPQPDGAEE
ncbi:rod shape-determining protein MreC [Brevundimonas sp.]|uniref:rod shape-determining protein MreC n=1 Tax=Brevundimonas sp. TaxID=1871086 RepID=UPI0025E05443|nr:rod shape-determining protein MreC [Brevundimonas sp.]